MNKEKITLQELVDREIKRVGDVSLIKEADIGNEFEIGVEFKK